MSIQINASERLKAESIAAGTVPGMDIVSLDVPLFIRVLEIAREEIKSDADLHRFVTNIISQQFVKREPLTMEDYDLINPTPTEVSAEKWSQPITDKIAKDPNRKEPPEGLFTKDANSIAQGLKKLHPDLKGASSALTFYRNRAGKNLSPADKRKLKDAQEKLHNLYPKKKG